MAKDVFNNLYQLEAILNEIWLMIIFTYACTVMYYAIYSKDIKALM